MKAPLSIDFDRRLYAQDIAGSKAHCEMLVAQGIIDQADGRAIVDGLERVLGEIEELLPPTAERRKRRFFRDQLNRSKPGFDGFLPIFAPYSDRAQVRFVKPALGLFG